MVDAPPVAVATMPSPTPTVPPAPVAMTGRATVHPAVTVPTDAPMATDPAGTTVPTRAHSIGRVVPTAGTTEHHGPPSTARAVPATDAATTVPRLIGTGMGVIPNGLIGRALPALATQIRPHDRKRIAGKTIQNLNLAGTIAAGITKEEASVRPIFLIVGTTGHGIIMIEILTAAHHGIAPAKQVSHALPVSTGMPTGRTPNHATIGMATGGMTVRNPLSESVKSIRVPAMSRGSAVAKTGSVRNAGTPNGQRQTAPSIPASVAQAIRIAQGMTAARMLTAGTMNAVIADPRLAMTRHAQPGHMITTGHALLTATNVHAPSTGTTAHGATTVRNARPVVLITPLPIRTVRDLIQEPHPTAQPATGAMIGTNDRPRAATTAGRDPVRTSVG